MARNTMDDLRDHCFEALERLKDASGDEIEQEIKRAKAVGDLTNRLVDTGKLELAYQKASADLLQQPKPSRLLTTAGPAEESPAN